MTETAKHCPECGYTKEDALTHWDHHLCKGGIPGYEKKDLSEQNRKQDDDRLDKVTSNAWDKFKEELASRPTIQPSPKDISDALNASFNWDMKRLSMHNLRTLRVAAGLWLEHLTNTKTE